MADQQNLGGESAVGRPGGNARTRNSAAFVVNDKSLRDLRNTWRSLTAEVRAFNQELAKVAKNASSIGILQSALGNVRMGGGTSISSSSINSSSVGLSTSQMRGSLSLGTIGSTSPLRPPTPGINTSPIAPLPSQRGGGGDDSGLDRSKRIVGGVAIAAGAYGTYISKSMPGITEMDYFANRAALTYNGGYANANKDRVRLSLSNMAGSRGSADTLAGFGAAQQIGFSYGTARAATISLSMSQVAAANPMGGVSAGGTAAAGLYNSQTNYALQSLGVRGGIGAGGRLNDINTVARSFLMRMYRGRMPTAQEITEGMQPGAPLYASMQSLPPDVQTAIVNFGLQQAAGGRGQGDSILASRNLLGRAASRVQGAMGKRTSGMMQQLLGFGAGATDVAGTAVNNPAIGYAAAGAGLGAAGAAQVGRTGLSSGGGFLGWKIGESALNAAAGALAGRGAAGAIGGRLTRGLANNAGMEAAESRGGTPVWVMNWPSGFAGGGGLLGGRGGLPGSGGGSNPVKDVDDVAKAGRFASLAAKVKAGLGGTVAFGGSGAAVGGAAGVAGVAGVAAGLFGAGYMGIKATELTMANHTARHELNSQSGDLLRELLQRVQLWGLMGIPAFKRAYDTQIRPALNRLNQYPAGSNEYARAADAVVGQLSRLTQRYRTQGARNMDTKINAAVAQQDAQHGAVALSFGGGAEPVVNTKAAASAARAGGGSGGQPDVVRIAEQYLGMTYVYGGSNPKQHFDCSGLTQWSYKQLGINLPRTAAEQQRATAQVPPNQARPGDLVTFGHPAHHVALYMGNGQMIAAPHTGDKIKIQPVYNDQTEYHRVGGSPSAAGKVGAAGSLGGSTGGASNAVAAALGMTGASNAAPASLSGPSGSGAGGGMFVEANPSTDDLGAFGGALGGGRTSGAAFMAGYAAGSGGGSVSTGASSSSTPMAGQVPAGAGQHYSVLQALKLAASVGFKGQGLYDAVAVMMAESGGNTRSTNYNKDSRHTIDRGLWQMNSYWHSEVKNPYDPVANAQAAYRISNGGSNWSQWSSWSHDHTAQRYISQVQKAAQSAGYREGSWEIARDQIAKLHKGEMVVPEKAAYALRRAVGDPGGGRGGGDVIVHLTAPITLTGTATRKDAADFVSMVTEELSASQMLRSIGAH